MHRACRRRHGERDAEGGRGKACGAVRRHRFPRPLLPVIPLGVDTHRFAAREDWRAAWRERRDRRKKVAILYLGRLSRHGKAHPLPMMAALGRAADPALSSAPHFGRLVAASARGGDLAGAGFSTLPRGAAARTGRGVTNTCGARSGLPRYLHPSGRQRPGDLRPGAGRGHGGRAAGSRYRLGRPPRYGTTRGRRDAGADHDGAPGEGREASLRYATSNIYYGTWLSLTARLTAVDISAAAGFPGVGRRSDA